jgi:hypothetical protein
MSMAINPQITPQHYDPLSSMIPPGEVKRQIPAEYNKDTIKKAANDEESWANIYPGFAGMFFPQHNQILDPTVSRPKLESPSLNTKKLGGVEQDVGRLLANVSELDKAGNSKQEKPLDKNLAEVALLQLFIQCMKMQRDQNETAAELTFDSTQRNQEANKKIKEEYFNKLDQLIAQKKQSEILKWVNWILYGALTTVGVASLALTLTASVVTAGAAIPLAVKVTMGLIKAAVAVSAGTASIYKGVLDYKNNEIVGTLEEKKWERVFNTRKIKSGMEEMRQSMEVISENWKELITVVNNWLQASLNR